MRFLRRIFCRMGWHDFAATMSGAQWVSRWCADCRQAYTVMSFGADADDIMESIAQVNKEWPPKRD